jgi:hypothetical protein
MWHIHNLRQKESEEREVKKLLIVSSISIVILMLAIVPVSANSIGWGASFPLVGDLIGGQRTTEVHAGITLPVATSSSTDGPDEAVWQGGYISLPNNTTGLFPEFQYLKTTPLIMGVDPKDLRENRVILSGACQYDKSSEEITINTAGILPGQHTLVYEQDQKASRKDTRVLIFRFAKRIEKTDTAAMIFTVTEPQPFLEDYCRLTEGKGFAEASIECKRLARVLYLEKEAGAFRLVKPELPYNLLVDAYWRQGQKMPRVGDVAPAPKVEVPVPAPAPVPKVEVPVPAPIPAPVAPVSTRVEFALNVISSASGAVSVQIGDKAYQGTSIPLCLEPGTYQAKVKIGSRSTDWVSFRVSPNMGPVNITAN